MLLNNKVIKEEVSDHKLKLLQFLQELHFKSISFVKQNSFNSYSFIIMIFKMFLFTIVWENFNQFLNW